MNKDLDDLARAAADALVTAMVTDSWEAVRHRFAGLAGHGNQRRMDAARAELTRKTGPDREKAQLAQARAWSIRLRDVLDDDPGAATGMQALVVELRAASAATAMPAPQQAHADRGSQAVNISGNTGEVYVGVGKVDKRRFRFVLIPINFFVRVTRKVAAAHPVTAVAAVVVAGGVCAGAALAQPADPPALAALAGSWQGSYTCAQGLTGLTLQVGAEKAGAAPVMLSFYPVPANPAVPRGSATFRGTLSGGTVRLTPVAWAVQPAGYEFTDFAGPLPKAGGSVFSGTVNGSECTTFSLRRAQDSPPVPDVAGTWVGSYTCAQGLTGLRLVIQSPAGTKLEATFNFYAVSANPSVPSGSFTMAGFTDPAGIFLNQGNWIEQPSGYSMVNIAGNLPASGGKTLNGAVVGCSPFSLHKVS